MVTKRGGGEGVGGVGRMGGLMKESERERGRECGWCGVDGWIHNEGKRVNRMLHDMDGREFAARSGVESINQSTHHSTNQPITRSTTMT